MAAPEPKTQPSVLEKLKKLQEERAKIDEATSKIMQAATAEILAKGELVIAELKEIGLDYRFVPGKARATTADPDKPCPICNFRTAPKNHDRRAHRNQPQPKKPFTSAELEKLGFTKVA